MSLEFTWLIHSISVILYIFLIGSVLRKRGLYAEVLPWSIAYLIIYLLIEVDVVGLGVYLLESVAGNWGLYGIFIGSVVLRHLSSVLTKRIARNWRWSMLGLIWFALTVGLNFVILPSSVVLHLTGMQLTSSDAIFGMLLVGWIIFAVATVRLSISCYRQMGISNIRNRIFCWGVGLCFLLIGNVLTLTRWDGPGTVFSGLAAITIVYALISPRVFYLGLAVRRALNNLVKLILQLASYVLSFLGIRYLFGDILSQYSLVFGAVLAILLVVLVNPLLMRIQAWMDGLFFGEDKDISRILREYSQSISNILDLELLSIVIVDTLQQVFDVERGDLFLVELGIGAKGEKQYCLRRGQDKTDASLKGVLPAGSALANALGQDRRSVTQGEIDMVPSYRTLTTRERTWLSRLNMDIYVPIHAQEEWVGIMTLGAKSSGEPYYAEDIELLATLADQTAVALQNTRLVENVMQVNSEFQRAYSAMDDAHTKLQRIDRAKSDFINITSHELRTPLAIISGYSQMLLEDAENKDDQAYTNIINGIFSGTTRLHEIVENMLEIAKIDMHELVLQKEWVNIETLLRKVCLGYAKVFRKRKLKLHFDEVVGNLPTIMGDYKALTRTFDQLVSNAVKYTPDGGSISISGRQLQEKDSDEPGEWIELIVSDTGIGIDPRFQDLIFTKFYQTGDVDLHSSGETKFKGGGPGLGLTIVRGLVEAHGGRVWAESPGYDDEKNPGSAFHVILPLDQK